MPVKKKIKNRKSAKGEPASGGKRKNFAKSVKKKTKKPTRLAESKRAKKVVVLRKQIKRKSKTQNKQSFAEMSNLLNIDHLLIDEQISYTEKISQQIKNQVIDS